MEEQPILDENKKPQRDIGDLKARLGLKKGGAPAPSTSQSPAGAPAGAVPAPPVAGIQSQPAAPPDPRRDPFAQQQAANLAAFYGINQSLPGSADSVGAEGSIAKGKAGTSVGVLIGAAVVALGIGYFFGGVFESRQQFNLTIDDSKKINDEVQNISKMVDRVVDTLKGAKGLGDAELAKKLGELGLVKPSTDKLFHSNYKNLEPVVVERLFTYYDNAQKLVDQVSEHARATEADKDAIANAAKSLQGRAEKRYAVVLNTSGPIPTAQLAELGDMVCNNGQKDCAPADLKGFQFRLGDGASYQERPVKGKLEQAVIPMFPTPFFKLVLSGNPDVLALKGAGRRLEGIIGTADRIKAMQKDVLADLKRSADRPKLFAF